MGIVTFAWPDLHRWQQGHSKPGLVTRWCLEHDLQIVQQSTLMTIGLHNEPAGAYLPSILF